MEGTSMASPHMVGVVALMKYAYPGLTPDKLDEWLNAGKLTDDIDSTGYDTRTGFGLINARKAVDVALAEAQTPGAAPQGRIVATPFSLDFGAQRSSMSVVLTTTAATADVVTKLTRSSQALTVSPTNVDAKTGLGTYAVTVDRSQLASGTTFLSLAVQTSHDTVTVPITVVKQGITGTSRSGDYGPIYVLAIDATTDEVVEEAAVNAKDGQYAWSLRAPKGSRLYLVAGGDLDQNQFICDAGEPCGGYPLLSDSLSTITLDDNMAGLNFSVAPMGMGGATAASLAGSRATPRSVATSAFRRPAR
jgi:serine protease